MSSDDIKDCDSMDREITEDEMSDWATFNDIDTGKLIAIKKTCVEACEDCVLDPDEHYRGPYLKGMKFTRIYTNGNNWFEVASPLEEVKEKL